MKLIDVYDTKEEKIILHDAPTNVVAKHFNKKARYINTAMHNGILIQNRYSIIDKGFKVEVSKDDFGERWDEAIKPFLILKKKREKVG